MSVTIEFSTPPQIAKRAGVSVEKIIGWILAGELRGYNFAAKQSGRPRYRIAEADWQEFLERRSAALQPTVPKRRPFPSSTRKFYR